MKRDVDLIRTLFFEVEKLPEDGRLPDIPIPAATDKLEFYPHVRLACEAGLVDAIDTTASGAPCWRPMRLTWSGHEFLDAYRSDTAWQKAKDLVASTTGAVTLEGLKVVIPAVLKSLIGIG
jgi:hypothetical protein